MKAYAKVGRAPNKRNKLRGFKKSARQENRKIAVSESKYKYSFKEMKELRFELMRKMEDNCYFSERIAYDLVETLVRLGFKPFQPYRCTCDIESNMSDEEVLKLSGLF